MDYKRSKPQEQIFIKFTRRAWCKGNRIIFNSFRKNTKRDDSINRRYYQKENC